MTGMIHDYLDQVWTELPLSMGRSQRRRIVCEIEDHLLESWDAERARKISAEEAMRRVLDRFGSPVAVAQEFAELDTPRRRQIVRFSLFGGLIAFLLLIVYSLVRYPVISSTSAIIVMEGVLCAGIVCLYGWIGISGTHFAAPVEVVGPWQGMKISLLSAPFLAGTSIASLLLSSVLWNGGAPRFSTSSLVSIDHLVHACATALLLLIWLGVTLWSSAWVAFKTGRKDLSIQVGFWSGLVTSLILAVTGLLMHYLFLNLSLSTTWPHDSTCMGSQNLAACEMNDLLGSLATGVLLLPFIGAVLGVFAGFIARFKQFRPQAPIATTRQQSRSGFPIMFCSIALAFFFVGVFTNLW